MNQKLMTLAIVSIIGAFGLIAYKMKDFDSASFKSSLSTVNQIIASFNTPAKVTTKSVAGIKLEPVTIGVLLLFTVTIFVLLKK